MPRPTRVHIDGALCYVTSRTPEGTALFKDEKDYRTYLDLLKTYQEKYGFQLFAFVLLPDHLHLCLELPRGGSVTISAVMHALNSRYTKYFTKRYGRTGHLFERRFKLTLIEKAPSLLRVTGYLHTHPKQLGVTEDVAGYRWSSFQSYLAAGTSWPGLCQRGEVSEVLQQLNDARPGWTYELYVQSVPEAEWNQLHDELEQPVVGSESFKALVERTREEVDRAPAPAQAAPAAVREPGPQPQPRPRPMAWRGRRPLAVTLSLAMASISLFAVVLASRNMAFLKQTVKVLAQENRSTLSLLSEANRTMSTLRRAALPTPERLSGTSWDIQIKPMYGTGSGRDSTDRLQFGSDKMASSELTTKGFPSVRYKMTPRKDGTAVWESLQIGPGGEFVSWRGEWNGQTMHGVMTRQLPARPVATFRFTGINLDVEKQPTSEI